ncbi:MAG: prenyltransferase/squalene oxidase repeat-containing protein [Thermoguttaceae bacterium]|jgi:hypothetical protein
MNSLRTNRVVDFFTGIDPAMGVLWLGLAAFTLGLLILRYTRWGQSHQLEKCMALSILAHLLLLGYVTTMRIVKPPLGGDSVCFIAMEEDTDSEKGEPGGNRPLAGKEQSPGKEQPWQLHTETAPRPKMPELKLDPPELLPESKRLLSELESNLLAPSPLGQTALDRITAPLPQPVEASAPIGRLVPIEHNDSTAAEATAPQSGNPNGINTDNVNLPGQGNLSKADDSDGKTRRADPQSNFIASLDEKSPGGADIGIDGISGTGGGSLPDLYKLRVMPNRSGVAQQHGATPESEKAVQIALHWLANNQADDGRWDPAEHNAGRELGIQGRNRQNAGSKADSGITGLALLAFLAGGHTHQQGPYAENVRCGLEYLLRIQASDGSLGGKGQAYEFMYCHAMAACAISEAYGMTHDPRLEKPVRRAIGFTVASQDSRGGGWRYRPGDPGDTSQLGWQLMALKSAELAGIPMPASTRSGIIRFLRSVSSGSRGGLASYRPGEGPSRPMTAEALVCWQFLGLPREHPACNEAGDYLLAELPGSGMANDYYWYYATIAMYQLQDPYWQRWNEALQSTLISRQVKDGPLAGSWNTDTLWGGYGGRVYTTAIAALALEVYYRFLPLYVAGNGNKQQVR